MILFLIFLSAITNAISQRDNISSALQNIADNGNCTSLHILETKLTPHPPSISNETWLFLIESIQRRLAELNCKQDKILKKRNIDNCRPESIGDGWCDVDCNYREKEWDGGDCCPHTCKTRERPFPCGSGGYQCKGAKKIPVWFATRTQLCYKWYADGDGGQCGGGASAHLCAGVGQMTAPYRDDTDKRPGGCRMSWGLETTGLQVPEWFKQVSICFRWFADGDGGQCGAGAPAESCAAVGSYTPVYRDDTDRRPGGCQMSWRINIPPNADYWAEDISICFKWWPDGDGGQCGGGAERRLCAVANSWTPYYRDDTDSRGGGCQMQWGLFV